MREEEHKDLEVIMRRKDKRWERLIKKKLFEELERREIEITKLSEVLKGDFTYLSRLKNGTKRLDIDSDLIPLLDALFIEPEKFLGEVLVQSRRDRKKEKQQKFQVEIIYE